MREKKSNIVVQKYIDNLAETPKCIDLNDLDEKTKETRDKIGGDTYNNIAY